MTEQAELEVETEELETEVEGVDVPEAEDDSDEVVVSIGDAPSPEVEETETAPEWVRELRKANREKDKIIRDLQAKVATETKPVAELPPKPKLSDFDYDEDAYDTARDQWDEQKRAFDDANRAAQAEQEAGAKAWQERLTLYETSKKALRVRDYDEAQAEAEALFNVTQQGIVIQGAENPAVVIYALGKNTSKAKELAAITDPVKFAMAIGRLETQLKVTNRKSPPPPEKTVTGGAGTGGTVDRRLDALRDAATKDPSKMKALLDYKKQLRAGK